MCVCVCTQSENVIGSTRGAESSARERVPCKNARGHAGEGSQLLVRALFEYLFFENLVVFIFFVYFKFFF